MLQDQLSCSIEQWLGEDCQGEAVERGGGGGDQWHRRRRLYKRSERRGEDARGERSGGGDGAQIKIYSISSFAASRAVLGQLG